MSDRPYFAGQTDLTKYNSIWRNGSVEVAVGSESVLLQVSSDLGILPDKRVQVVVCVEGPNDVVFLQRISQILRGADNSLVDLSSDPRVCIQIEDHYWDGTDAAVVFRRLDRQTGEDRFIYHGEVRYPAGTKQLIKTGPEDIF